MLIIHFLQVHINTITRSLGGSDQNGQNLMEYAILIAFVIAAVAIGYGIAYPNVKWNLMNTMSTQILQEFRNFASYGEFVR